MSLPFSPGLIRAPVWIRKATATAEAPSSLVNFVMPNATTDAAPAIFTLISGHAYAQATSNTTGAALRLAPGMGRRFITVDDYSQAGVGTVTVTANGTATVLTAGTDFTAETSNNVTATNLATAIDAVAGVTATASAAVVYVTPDDSTYSLTLARSVAAFATVTTGTNGAVNVGYGDLLTIGPTNVTLASGGLYGDTGVSLLLGGNNITQLTLDGTNATLTGSFYAGAGAYVGFTGRSLWSSSSDGLLTATRNDGTTLSDLAVAGAITSGSGTGVTVNATGYVRTLVHKVTVTYAALAAAATTADKVIATLPAKVRLVGVLADTTTPYTGGGVTAATLIVGKTTGGNEYIVSHDVFSAAIFVGDLDADLGTSINRANAIQGGDLASWTGTTNVSVRLTTTTANTDQLTAGSTTYYLTTESMP